MTDLTDFGVAEPQEPPAAAESDEDEQADREVWSVCVDCERAGYDVTIRGQYSVPLCPRCFAHREGLA